MSFLRKNKYIQNALTNNGKINTKKSAVLVGENPIKNSIAKTNIFLQNELRSIKMW